MATKKSKRGGYRPGAGAKKTGRNTTCISFSVHKDFAELIKSMVKSKVIELKKAAIQTPAAIELPKDFIKIKKVAAVDGNGKKVETCAEAAEKRMKQKSKFKPQPFTSAYLQSRRIKKLGLK